MQVRGAISAIRYTEQFPRLPADFVVPGKRAMDMFDLLEYVFGFQVWFSYIYSSSPLLTLSVYRCLYSFEVFMACCLGESRDGESGKEERERDNGRKRTGGRGLVLTLIILILHVEIFPILTRKIPQVSYNLTSVQNTVVQSSYQNKNNQLIVFYHNLAQARL